MAPYQSHNLVRNMIWQEEMAVMVLISIYTNQGSSMYQNRETVSKKESLLPFAIGYAKCH